MVEVPPDGRTWLHSYASASGDGRLVAWGGQVDGDPDTDHDVFLRDRAARTTIRISRAPDGSPGDGDSFLPAVAPDGATVVFWSRTANLAPDPNGAAADLFAYDVSSGKVSRLPGTSDPSKTIGWNYRADLSADGRMVAFDSTAALVPDDVNGLLDTYVHDRDTGITTMVSRATDGTPGDASSYGPDISADGRFVAFHGAAGNLDPRDTTLPNGVWPDDAFVHDRLTGTTQLVSLNEAGAQANGPSYGPAIDADGSHVAYVSWGTNLVPWDTNGDIDVFVWERATGKVERVSVASSGRESDGRSWWPEISPDGRYVLFDSGATTLVPNDTNTCLPGPSCGDMFVHDRLTGATDRASMADDGAEALFPSVFGEFARGGREVMFASTAWNLTPDDEDANTDVFVRDRGPATGIGELEAREVGGSVVVDGWFTVAGAVLAESSDPPADGGRVPGAELTGAAVTYRPEDQDVLFRIEVNDLPGQRPPSVPGGWLAVTRGGLPGLVYGVRFRIGAVPYEIRALRTSLDESSTATPVRFALYRCEGPCVEVGRLAGGFGTTGEEIRVSVPVSLLPAGEGVTLSGLRAFVGPGEAGPGTLADVDVVDLGTVTVPHTSLRLGLAPAGTSPEDVVYGGSVASAEGAFTLALSAPGPGDHDVWARICLGQECGTASAPVVVG